MRLAGLVALGLVAVFAAPAAKAAYVLNFTEAGGNVVASGSGSFNTNAMRLAYPHVSVAPAVSGSKVAALTGHAGKADTYSASFGGIVSFGLRDCLDALSGTGDLTGFSMSDRLLAVPAGYESGQFLSGSSLYAGTSLAAMQLVPGSYVYTFGSGASRDTVTVNIGPQAVPEPASLAVLGAGLVGLGLARRRFLRARPALEGGRCCRSTTSP